jgi:hypothetical protein
MILMEEAMGQEGNDNQEEATGQGLIFFLGSTLKKINFLERLTSFEFK